MNGNASYILIDVPKKIITDCTNNMTQPQELNKWNFSFQLARTLVVIYFSKLRKTKQKQREETMWCILPALFHNKFTLCPALYARPLIINIASWLLHNNIYFANYYSWSQKYSERLEMAKSLPNNGDTTAYLLLVVVDMFSIIIGDTISHSYLWGYEVFKVS